MEESKRRLRLKTPFSEVGILSFVSLGDFFLAETPQKRAWKDKEYPNYVSLAADKDHLKNTRCTTYIVTSDNQIIYVGQTGKSIFERFRMANKADYIWHESDDAIKAALLNDQTVNLMIPENIPPVTNIDGEKVVPYQMVEQWIITYFNPLGNKTNKTKKTIEKHYKLFGSENKDVG